MVAKVIIEHKSVSKLNIFVETDTSVYQFLSICIFKYSL